MHPLHRLAAPCLAVALLAGCAGPTGIKSNVASGYNADIQRIFVLSGVGTEFDAAFPAAFEQRLQGLLSSCGAAAEVSTVGPLDLDNGARQQRMAAFKPDAVVSIQRVGGTKNQYNVLVHAVYDARLTDVRSNKLVWRAQLDFYRGLTPSMADRGQALAADLAGRLKQDKLLPACDDRQALR